MILPASAYAHAVAQDRDIAAITARNIATGRLDDRDIRGFIEDRQRAWRDCIQAAARTRRTRDVSDWYAQQIAATERRIARAEATIAAPIPGDEPGGLAHNNWRRRQAAGDRYLDALNARAAAERDLPAARARLAWLAERSPA